MAMVARFPVAVYPTALPTAAPGAPLPRGGAGRVFSGMPSSSQSCIAWALLAFLATSLTLAFLADLPLTTSLGAFVVTPPVHITSNTITAWLVPT